MRFSFPPNSLALAGALLLAAAPAAAQPGTAVRAGQTVNGSLAASDTKLDDGSFYDQYVYRGRPGEQVVVTMRSGAFDTYLSAGAMNGATFASSATDDDGAGGTDSRLTVAVGESGVLVIRANSLTGGATGAYTLEVAGGSTAERPQPAGQMAAISAGQTVNGQLQSSDMKLGDNSYADEYRYEGRAGEQLVITLRSSAFDTYLVWGTGQGTAFRSAQTDDDGAGGTDSRLNVTVGSNGTYTIRANSLAASSTGAYTLTVERAGQGATPVATRPQPSAGGGEGTIAAGQTVSGQLQASDMKLADNSYADEYRYEGRPGEEIVITLRSPTFDTYLVWGAGQGSTFRSEKTDDDGAGGTDSRLTVTVGSSGTYTIRANSLAANTTGAYTLSVESTGTGQAVAAGGVIRAGQNVSGRLERSDPRLPDNSHYDSYVYQGTPGEQILITLTSPEFDTYLRWGRGQGAQFQLLGTDDDAGGGTNSRMQVTVDASGTYTIQANSLAANTTGAYTLAVERASGAAPSGAQTLSMGQSVSGRLDASDPKLSDNSHYDLYVYRGRPGERVLVTMRSTDFDTYMAWGRLAGSRFEAESRDDDGGGGTNSQLIATVGASGTYAVQANSLAAGATGSYTLSVQPVGATGAQQTASAPAGAATVTAGQTINGQLTRSDPMLSDSSFYDQYV
ncbi:MAG TPA: hypothetical protein VF613_10880, partial [Longimicrobium sp.]